VFFFFFFKKKTNLLNCTTDKLALVVVKLGVIVHGIN